MKTIYFTLGGERARIITNDIFILEQAESRTIKFATSLGTVEIAVPEPEIFPPVGYMSNVNSIDVQAYTATYTAPTQGGGGSTVPIPLPVLEQNLPLPVTLGESLPPITLANPGSGSIRVKYKANNIIRSAVVDNFHIQFSGPTVTLITDVNTVQVTKLTPGAISLTPDTLPGPGEVSDFDFSSDDYNSSFFPNTVNARVVNRYTTRWGFYRTLGTNPIPFVYMFDYSVIAYAVQNPSDNSHQIVVCMHSYAGGGDAPAINNDGKTVRSHGFAMWIIKSFANYDPNTPGTQYSSQMYMTLNMFAGDGYGESQLSSPTYKVYDSRELRTYFGIDDVTSIPEFLWNHRIYNGS